MRIPDTEFNISPEGRVYHLQLRADEISDRIILVGDQDRVDLFKKFLSDIELDRRSREFHTVTGRYKGQRVTVLSTGIGTDNVDICVTEHDGLANIDAATHEPKKEHKSLTLLRVGTSGALQPDIEVGSFVFSHAAVGLDNVLNWYAGRDEVCDLAMEKAFLEQVSWNRHLHDPYFVEADAELESRFDGCTVKGVTLSAPGFYGPQGREVRAALAMPDMLDDFEAFRYGQWRLTNFEMESSVLFGLSRILGHKAGTVCVILGNRYHKNNTTDYPKLMDELAVLSLEKIIL